MKNLLKKIIITICAIAIAISVLYLFKLRFSNIDMTDLRLFITYWKQGLISFIVIVLSVIVLDKTITSLK